MSRVHLVFQNEYELKDIPSEADFNQWVTAVSQYLDWQEIELTLRIVDEEESQQLNETYRDKAYPTNVLSFPFELPPGVPESEFQGVLGDLVVCAPVVDRESIEQGKESSHHWAHMVVHGALHLAGYDHQNDQDAEAMELIEIAILCTLGIPNPYESNFQ